MDALGSVCLASPTEGSAWARGRACGACAPCGGQAHAHETSGGPAMTYGRAMVAPVCGNHAHDHDHDMAMTMAMAMTMTMTMTMIMIRYKTHGSDRTLTLTLHAGPCHTCHTCPTTQHPRPTEPTQHPCPSPVPNARAQHP